MVVVVVIIIIIIIVRGLLRRRVLHCSFPEIFSFFLFSLGKRMHLAGRKQIMGWDHLDRIIIRCPWNWIIIIIIIIIFLQPGTLEVK